LTVMACPVCLGSSIEEVIRTHSITAAAEYFIPAARSRDRHLELLAVLRRLWRGAEFCEVHRCGTCGFGFPIPYVAGDAEFYNLIYGGNPHYPANRWEFGQTISVLENLTNPGPIALLEAGAGEGWFLEALRRSKGSDRFKITALEYDRAALKKLAARGFSARAGSLTDLGASEQFNVICLFHTLEHMDDVGRAFQSLHDALRPGGHAFVSVPHGPAVDQQEEVVRFWDMPPIHVGRWTQEALRIAAQRHGLEARAIVVEPLRRLAELTRLSTYQVNSRAHRLNAIALRPMRVLLKGAVAAAWVPILAWRIRPPLANSVWAHLQRP
jgi:SAM-dependent methyltransferase